MNNITEDVIEEVAQKPESLPEKFWDAEKGEIRVEALLNSYLSLEKKLSSGLIDPNNPDQLKKMLGVPEMPDLYDVKIDHGLFDVDPIVNQKLHEKMFTADQVQMVYDLAGEFLIPMISKIAAEYEADREVEKLMQEFGGAEEWAEISRQLMAYGQKNLSPKVFENLSQSYDGVMAIYRMMKGQGSAMLDNGNVMTGQNAQELQSMMRDPKYWRDRDPAFISKVTKGFEAIYGQQG
ncbi:MAG: hypothetical protein CMH30_06755 [Micavibrio sp.]|nr:hypothetical protein [Micavibrio sp.]|tara:strand:- start:2960 stop:3667 length:708 start_codon:yes stop_codon:yes gene_type:complete